MTGLVLLSDFPDDSHLRLEWLLRGADAQRLGYWDRRGLGSVRLLSSAQLCRELGPDRLGPDALRVTADQLEQRLGASRRAVKVGLLDQRAVAGIGNLYASEILNVAGIHPGWRCDRINHDGWRRIHSAMRHVLSEAIRCEGSTLSDGTYRNVTNQAGGYQDHHRVYDRQGQTCPSCQRGQIRRIIQSQRSTYFCPHCQAATLTRPKMTRKT